MKAGDMNKETLIKLAREQNKLLKDPIEGLNRLKEQNARARALKGVKPSGTA